MAYGTPIGRFLLKLGIPTQDKETPIICCTSKSFPEQYQTIYEQSHAWIASPSIATTQCTAVKRLNRCILHQTDVCAMFVLYMYGSSTVHCSVRFAADNSGSSCAGSCRQTDDKRASIQV